MKTNSIVAQIVGLAMGSVVAASAQTTLIDLQFTQTGDTVMSGAAILGSVGDIWNPIVGDQNGQALTNSLGATVAGTSWYFTTGHGFFTEGNGPSLSATPAALMESYFYGTGGEGGIIYGLTPGDAFTLVLYGAGNAVGQGDTFSLQGDMTGGNTGSTLSTTAADQDINNGIGDAYNTFTGIVGASGDIQINMNINTAGIDAGNSHDAMEGLQLEEVAVPEPGTYAMMLGGLGSLVWLARRRQAKA